MTHVVFRDGYRKTYNTAIERKIPLVSAKWVENCRLANKILNPIDYPPVDIEKYTKKRPVNYNHAVSIDVFKNLIYVFKIFKL